MRGPVDAGDAAQQGGLARSVEAEQIVDRPVFKRAADVLEWAGGAVSPRAKRMGEVVYFNHHAT